MGFSSRFLVQKVRIHDSDIMKLKVSAEVICGQSFPAEQLRHSAFDEKLLDLQSPEPVLGLCITHSEEGVLDGMGEDVGNALFIPVDFKRPS